MISRVLVLFLMHLVFHFAHSQIFFRKDYSYIDESNSFYKLNTQHKTRHEAKYACEREGATLFYPEDESEVIAVTEYWKSTQIFIHSVIVNVNKSEIITPEDYRHKPKIDRSFEPPGDVCRVIEGYKIIRFSTMPSLSHLQAEFSGGENHRTTTASCGKVIAGVYGNWERGEPNNAGGKEDCVVLNDQRNFNDVDCNSRHPFICKKTNETVEWNKACNMSYPGYTFDKELGKCYKVHLKPRDWNDAYATCYGELSYLAVVDDETEAAHLINLTNNSSKELEIKPAQIHVGFFHLDGWITIKGLPLHLSGYSKWAPLQPDGGIGEDCGAMSNDGLFHDIPCSQKMNFICEHEMPNI